MKNFFSEMLKCKREIYARRDRLLADVYSKVQSFVESGKYSACKKAEDIAKMSLKGYDARVISEHFGLKYDTIRTEKRLISNELWGIFPTDFFEKLLDYRNNKTYIDDCLYSLDNFGMTSDKVILLDVVRNINALSDVYSDEEYLTEELQNEFDFLLRYSKEFFENDLSTVNISKLKYILDVLDMKKGDSFIRSKMLKKVQVGC